MYISYKVSHLKILREKTAKERVTFETDNYTKLERFITIFFQWNLINEDCLHCKKATHLKNQ